MPSLKQLSARSGNPASFACDAGHAPDVGFSTTKKDGGPSSLSVSFVGSNISDVAKTKVVANLLGVCENKTNAGDVMSALNCAPGLGLVQTCSNLYNCNATNSVNGTTLGAAQTNSVSAHLTLFANSSDLSAPAVPCYLENLQESLANATRDYPVASKSTSGASSLKVGKVGIMALATSALLMVLQQAV